MATTIEFELSRGSTVGPDPSFELVYRVFGTIDDTEVRAAVDAMAPATYGGLIRDHYTVNAMGGGVWEGLVRYKRPEGTDEYTFETSGGNIKRTQSRETIASYAPSGNTAPDFQGAIGVAKDRVEGAEIVVPVFSWSETHQFTSVDQTYIDVLFALTGTVNDATFKGRAAGEVLFQGASGSKRGFGPWEITYKFAANPNLTGLTIGNITGIDVPGWAYMWVYYDDTVDSTAFALTPRPVSVYVERVYPSADFSGLNIGT